MSKDKSESAGPIYKVVYSVDEALEIFPASRSILYREIRDGKLRAKKIGARTVILHEDLMEYLRALPDVDPNKESPE